MSGFAVLYREATDHPLFAGDVARFGAWCWLVTRACWKPTPFDIRGQIVTLDRGQICVSVRQLGDAWGMSKSAVERFLTRLKTETMIETEAGHGRLIITICNYAKYQDLESADRDTSGTPAGTPAGHQRDTKEPLNHKTIEDEEANASPSSTRGRAKFNLPDWVPKEPWDAFVAMRVRIRKPMTDHAKTLAVRELAKLAEDGHPPGDVLNQSTFKSYLGLFPIKDQRNGYPGQNRNQSGSSSLDAMRRAIELTGGSEECRAAEPGAIDPRADPLPYPVRAIGNVQR